MAGGHNALIAVILSHVTCPVARAEGLHRFPCENEELEPKEREPHFRAANNGIHDIHSYLLCALMAQDAAGPPAEPCPSPGLAMARQGRASALNHVRLREVTATHLLSQYYCVHRKRFTQQTGSPVNTLPARQKSGTLCVTRASLLTGIQVTSRMPLVTTWGGLCCRAVHAGARATGSA